MLGCISLPSFHCFRLRSFSTGFPCQSPRAYVSADGFFLSFIFVGEGIVSLGGRLARVYLSAVFSLFPLALILDWLPCQSPRAYVSADGFFFKFHFCGEGIVFARRAPFLGCLSVPSFDCFRLRSFSTGFLASLRGRMSLRTAFF